MRLSISENANATTLEHIQKMNMQKIQRNMAIAANTSSGNSGAGVYSNSNKNYYSNHNNHRGITPVGALSQRSSVASAMQHTNRGAALAVLLQSNNNTQGGEQEQQLPTIGTIGPRVQTTNENKRASVNAIEMEQKMMSNINGGGTSKNVSGKN